MSFFFIRLLECWYAKTEAVVKWGGSLSHPFLLRSGTRQGAVLSPALFSLCVDDLLVKLNESGFGCTIKENPLAACMFADDLLLMTITIADLQQLLYICQDELQLLDMSINVSKTAYIRIGDRWGVLPAPVKLRGAPITLS